MKYVVFTVAVPKGVCRLRTIDKVDAWPEMQAGRSQAGKFPGDASFEMDSRVPKDIKVADALFNTNAFLVVSGRFKSFLEESNALAKNEVFEVAIVNHKGRKEPDPFYLVHQIEHPFAADTAQTVGVPNGLVPGTYLTLSKLVLDESKIDPALAIFRIAEFPRAIFFRRDFAEKVTAQSFSGVSFTEIANVMIW
jgi:hypothetical protein